MTESKGAAKNRTQTFLITSVLPKLVPRGCCIFTFLCWCHDSLKETLYF